MTGFAAKKCLPCEGIGRAMTADEVKAALEYVPAWNADGAFKVIHRDYVMKDFVAAVAFINSIAAVAEQENHHPDIHLTGYRNLRIELNTHALGGLTENDFILAAKIDALKPVVKK